MHKYQNNHQTVHTGKRSLSQHTSSTRRPMRSCVVCTLNSKLTIATYALHVALTRYVHVAARVSKLLRQNQCASSPSGKQQGEYCTKHATLMCMSPLHNLYRSNDRPNSHNRCRSVGTNRIYRQTPAVEVAKEDEYVVFANTPLYGR